MKITPSFTHSQAILGVYDFLLSDEHNQSYINPLRPEGFFRILFSERQKVQKVKTHNSKTVARRVKR